MLEAVTRALQPIRPSEAHPAPPSEAPSSSSVAVDAPQAEPGPRATDPAAAEHARAAFGAMDAAAAQQLSAPEIPVSPARSQAIQAWSEQLASRSPPGPEGSSHQAEAIVSALAGKSPLGKLTASESKLLINGNVDRWTTAAPSTEAARSPVPDHQAMRALAVAAQDQPNIAVTVGTAFAERAARLERAVEGGRADATARANAESLATAALWTGVKHPEVGARIVEKLGPANAGLAVRALNLDSSRPRGTGPELDERAGVASNLLKTLAQSKITPAARAVIDNAFATVGESALQATGASGLPKALGAALAHAWHPQDKKAEAADARRLGDLLGSKQGRQLLVNDDLPLEQRLVNLEAVRTHPTWDKKLLSQRSDVYAVPEVAQALSKRHFESFAARVNDTPRALKAKELDAVVRAGHVTHPKEVAKKIEEWGGEPPKVTPIPVTYSSAKTGPVDLTIFRVQDKATGQDRFVDQEGRKYDSFEEWQRHNKLPPGTMTYPPRGHITKDAARVSGNTPDTRDSLREKATGVMHRAALVGGAVAGGALVIGSGGTLSPVVAGVATGVVAASGVYLAAESGVALNERARLGESVSLRDPAARAQWLGLATNALSATGLGLAKVAAGGRATRIVNGGASLAEGASTVDSAVGLARGWGDMSVGEQVGAVLPLAATGAQALADARVPKTRGVQRGLGNAATSGAQTSGRT